jgi:hypothetical protein
MRYVSLDEQTALASAQSDPHGFVASFSETSVVLDEFQYAPKLIPAIKLISDQLQPDQCGRSFLTGSADLLILSAHDNLVSRARVYLRIAGLETLAVEV